MKTALRVLAGFVLLLVLACPASALNLAEFQVRFAELRSDGAAPEAILELAAEGLAAAGDDADLKSAALTAKGYALYEQGDYEVARPVLEEAAELNAQAVLARVALSNIYYSEERYKEAGELLVQAGRNLSGQELQSIVFFRSGRYANLNRAIHVKNLWNEFDANPYAVGNKYSGGLVVRGTISEISPNADKSPQVVFYIDDSPLQRITCKFNKERIEKIKPLRKGQDVLIHGSISPEYSGEIVIDSANVETTLPMEPLNLKDFQ